MDWKDIADEVAKLGLPILGAALPLPGGAAIGEALAATIGAPSSQPVDVLTALKQTVGALDAAKQFEMQNHTTLVKIAVDAERAAADAEYRDRADARGLAAQEIAKGNALSTALAALVRPVAGFGAMVLVGHAHFQGVPLDAQTADTVNTIFKFYFGGRVIEKSAPVIMAGLSNAAQAVVGMMRK